MKVAAHVLDTDTIGLIVLLAALCCVAFVAWRQGAFRSKAERNIEGMTEDQTRR
jgi:hypothetical protein